METVFLTGGNGYLGQRLIARILQENKTRLHEGKSLIQVVAWLHAPDPQTLTEKTTRLKEVLQSTGPSLLLEQSLQVVGGSFSDEQPFCLSDAQKQQLSHVVHLAADTRFNVDQETAAQVNVEGSHKLMQFAQDLPALKRFCLVSTVYTAGQQTGVIPEVLHAAAAGFCNHYEASKWQAEQQLATEFSTLPWQIARVATVIADDASGTVGQYNAVHNTLKLLFYGLLSLMPGEAETPLYFVTGDFVTEALFQMLFGESAPDATAQRVSHLCHAEAFAPTLGELLSWCYAVFQTDPDFQARHILPPVLCDEESFGLMSGAVQGFGGSVVNQALSSVTPFAKQLYLPKLFATDGVEALLPKWPLPEPRALVEATCQYLVRTRWGRNVV